MVLSYHNFYAVKCKGVVPNPKTARPYRTNKKLKLKRRNLTETKPNKKNFVARDLAEVENY